MESIEQKRTVMRTYLMASDISLGGSCWREPPLATNQRALALFVRLPSRFSLFLGLVVHHPRPPRFSSPAPEFLSFRIADAKVVTA